MGEPSTWSAPNCKYEIQGDRVITDGTFKWKVSGTSVGALLGKSPYATPFTTTARLLGLWDEDISAKPAVIAGKLLEERIIDYLSSSASQLGTFLKAEDVFEERKGAHDKWVSDFEDDVFSGHVDGIVSRDGSDYILEIKTTSRRAFEAGSWDGHPPEHYLWQVYLYNHFITKQDKAYFGLGILDEDTYSNPNMWVPNRENCRVYEVSIDQAYVASVLDGLRHTYAFTVGCGCTLPYNPVNIMDNRLMTHLTDLSGDVESLNELVSKWREVKAANDLYNAQNKHNTDLEAELKDRIKVLMDNFGLAKAGPAVIRSSVRRSFDFRKADTDGFDYSKYVTETRVNSLTIKE